MTDKRPRSLEEMAADAAKGNSGNVVCPKCGCCDFRVYGHAPSQSVTIRYKCCRHCGHRVVTSTIETERIVRDVNPHSDDEDEVSLKIAPR